MKLTNAFPKKDILANMTTDYDVMFLNCIQAEILKLFGVFIYLAHLFVIVVDGKL